VKPPLPRVGRPVSRGPGPGHRMGSTRGRTSRSWRPANFVQVVEQRQGHEDRLPEEVAWRMGFIDGEHLRRIAEPLAKSGYGEYLLGLLA